MNSSAYSVIIVGLAALGACSAAPVTADLTEAESAEATGEHDKALQLYQSATTTCRRQKIARLRRADCASAYLGRAELLDRMDRKREAARAYEGIAKALAGDSRPSAIGTYRAGRLYLQLGEEKRGYRLLWRTLTDYPNQGVAADALHQLVRDGRRRNVAQLYRVLGTLVQPLAGTEIADNLLYTIAELADTEFADPTAALALYDKITVDFTTSGLRDDALWRAANLARKLGDPRGAVRRLKLLLATREVAFGAGSYFSIWLDDAQLELGRIQRDDLDDHRGALAAFKLLGVHYPASILIDDALWERAVTWDRLGNSARTCAVLAQLGKDWPDSKYHLTRTGTLRRKHHCR